MNEIFNKLLATPEQQAEQISMDEINTMYQATEAELQHTQEEITQLENQVRTNNQELEQNTDGDNYQSKLDKLTERFKNRETKLKQRQKERIEKLREYYKGKITDKEIQRRLQLRSQKIIDTERINQRIAKLKANQKLLQERQRERQKIREQTQKISKQINRMAQSQNINWNRQQEIKHLLDTYDVSKLRSLSLEDIKYLQSQVKELYDIGRRELAEKRLLDRERVDGIRQGLRDTMSREWNNRPRGAVRDQQDTDRQYTGIRGRARRILDWGMARTMGAQRFFDYLDNPRDRGHYNGPWTQFFSDRVNEAHDTKLQWKFERLAAMEQEMQRLGISPEMLAETRDINVPHQGPGGWRVEELMGVYAGLKNQNSRDAILFGNFVDAENNEQANAWATACVDALSENEKALADFVIQEYEQHFDRINESLVNTYNRGMDHQENYTPMIRLEVTARNNGAINPDTAESSPSSGLGTVERGFSQSRVNFKQRTQPGIRLDLMSVWHSQVERQEHAAAFGQVVQDMRRVLIGKGKNDEATIRKMIRATRGRYAWDMVKQYANIIANNETQNAYDTLDDVAKYFARNMSIAYLCGNAGTVLKQLGSFPRVIPYAGAAATINSIGQCMQNPRQFMEECYRLDPQLRARNGDPFIQELRQGSGAIYDNLLRWGNAPIGLMDRLASCIVFKAVYDANIHAGASEQDAIRQAQRVVLLTQPATNIKDKPLIWQQHGYARLAMMFTNDMAQTWGMTLYDLTAAIQRGDIPAALSTTVGLALAAMLIKALTSGGPDEPDDPEEWAKWIASAFAENTINSIPLIGKEAVTLWDSRKGMFNNNQSAFVAPFAKLASGVDGLWDDKDDNDERAIWNLIEGGALLAPFPATGIHRIYNVGKEAAKGDFGRALKRAVGMRLEDKKMKKAM